MRSRYTLLCLVSVVLLTPFAAHTQVVISEIMYDLEGVDTGYEWIEVFNAGTASVPLTEWKLFEANTNHKITAVSGGETLVPGAYAVIADNAANFLADNAGYSGVLFDSTFSLSNSGETLSMRNPALVDVDSVSYTPDMGAAGDGKSLQRGSVSAATFTADAASPGTGSLSGGVVPETEKTAPVSETTTVPSTSAPSSTSNFPVEPQIFAYSGKDRTVIVGADVALTGRAFNKNGEPIDNVRFLWNFGDGAITEGESVLHSWAYPGRYVVVLNIAENKNAGTHSMVVTAEPANIGISMGSNGSIVLTNNAGRTLDLSGWHLTMANRLFRLPEYSLLLAGASVAFPSSITGLTVLMPPAALLYPNGVVAVREGEVPASSVPRSEPVSMKSPVIDRQTQNVPIVEEASSDEVEVADAATSSMQVASAAAASSSIPWILGLGAFIGLAAVAVLGIRSRSSGLIKNVEEEAKSV